jgi:hypothetical protein
MKHKKADGNGVKWVQDKAFQKGLGDSSETSDNLSGIPIPCHFLSRSHYSHRPVILTKEERRTG